MQRYQSALNAGKCVKMSWWTTFKCDHVCILVLKTPFFLCPYSKPCHKVPPSLFHLQWPFSLSVQKTVSFKKRLKYGCSVRGTSLLITKGIRKMVKLSVSLYVLSLNGMERKKMDFFTLTSIMDYFWIPNVDLYEYYSFSVLSSFNPIFNPLSSITHPSYMQVCFPQQHLYPPPCFSRSDLVNLELLCS